MTNKILIVYFSRIYEQYSVGNISKGNTAIVAEIIAKKTNANLFEIKPLNDNYPTTYKELTEYAEKERENKVKPKIKGTINNFDDYETIFIGYPNWWGEPPMIIYSFIESYDFSNKTVIPFITHEGSGMGGTDIKIKNATKSKDFLKGFEIYGHIAQNNIKETEKQVDNWLKELNLLK